MKKRQLKINKLKTILPPLRTAGLPPPPIPPQRKPHQFIPYVEHHQEKKGSKKIRWKEKNFVEDENTIQIRTTERISTTFSRSFNHIQSNRPTSFPQYLRRMPYKIFPFFFCSLSSYKDARRFRWPARKHQKHSQSNKSFVETRREKTNTLHSI